MVVGLHWTLWHTGGFCRAQHLWPSGLFTCLPHGLELCPGFLSNCFGRLLKTYLFTWYQYIQCV